MSSKRKEHKIPKHYLAGLSKDNRATQLKFLRKSRKAYKKGVYIPRPQLKSFKSKKSRHVVDFERKYNIKINDLKAVAKVTGVPVPALKKIIKKGMGAYYSGGSRPNQTAHSWAYARLGSVLLKRNSYKVDKHVLDEYNVKEIKRPKKKLGSSKVRGGSKIISCCKSKTGKTVVCVRKTDKKLFNVKTRRFSREKCIKGPVNGFTMRSSCAPWKDC
jgi:hypothetical protein